MAIIGIQKPTDYKKVVARARAVTTAMEEHSDIYAVPDPALQAIKDQVEVVNNFSGKVDAGDHSFIASRDQASTVLFRMLEDELIYVNKIADGDKAKLTFSGFKVSAEPTPRPVPGQVIIKDIDDGAEAHTAKIKIEPIGQYKVIFCVQMSETPDDEASWSLVLIISNSFKLIIPKMVHGKEVWFRVNASNAQGTGLWSNPIPFISRH